MIGLKELLSNDSHHKVLSDPSVSITSQGSTSLFLKIDKKDVIQEANYSGPKDPWYASLCSLVIGKTLTEAFHLSEENWKTHFKSDQTFWDLWSEISDHIFFPPLEPLRAAIDEYRGRSYLYEEASPLVCRCFGIREDEVLQGDTTKAGMGCRSCLPQIERLKKISKSKNQKARRFKLKPYVDWIILSEEKLALFPYQAEWGMEIVGFKGNGIVISYSKVASQKEVEVMTKSLQDYLREEVDPDLAFFLRRS